MFFRLNLLCRQHHQQLMLSRQFQSLKRCSLPASVSFLRPAASTVCEAEITAGSETKSMRLRQLLEAQGQHANFVPRSNLELASLSHVKSIICMANGQAVVCILLLSDSIDLKKAAAALQVTKNKLRLAKPAEVAATGFEIGAVPPLGHIEPLPTLIDQKVVELSSVCSGTGNPDELLVVDTASLVCCTEATLCDLAKGSGSQLFTCQGAASSTRMPHPWAPGAAVVALSGRIASRRRLGSCLVFADLVPMDAPLLPQENAASMRELWAHPETGLPSKLQLVMGATIEARVGAFAMALLLDQVKVGGHVSVVGRVQTPAAGSSHQVNGSPSHLEVVCHDVKVLPAPAALRAAQQPKQAARRAKQPPPQRGGSRRYSSSTADAATPVYSMAPGDIVLVDSLAALQEMRRHIFEEDLAAPLQGAAYNTDASGSEPLPTVRPANGSVADGCCSSLDSDELKGQPRSQSAVAHSYRCVGIDAEWEPSDGFSPVTLLQLATRRKAFLVDMLWFCSSPPSSWAQPGGSLPALSEREAALSDCLVALFSAQHIVKAGFGLQGDLKYLCRSFPHLPCFRCPEGESGPPDVVRFADVRRLALDSIPPRAGLSKAMGLAKLVAVLLGKRLDKSQQVSSWGTRPLTEEQLAYAGADAQVLTALLDAIVTEVAQVEVPLGAFPEELTERLSVVAAAEEARLWHRLQPFLLRPYVPPKVTEAEDRLADHQPESATAAQPVYPPNSAVLARRALRQRTPRMETSASEHSANLAALDEFLGRRFPGRPGRTVVCQVAAADEHGTVPTSVPRYNKRGGIVLWRNALMLFVNSDPGAVSAPYPNTFPEGGRRLVWFPSAGQSRRNPVIRRMLGMPTAPAASEGQLGTPPVQNGGDAAVEGELTQTHVLLFARCLRESFVYCGRLCSPAMDWEAGSNGVFVWELQDYERLADKEAFQALVLAANGKVVQRGPTEDSVVL